MPADGIELYVSSGLERRLPEELHVHMRGVWHKRVAASWNGMPWVM